MATETCVKCGKSGSVLVCRSSKCPVSIHESCSVSSSLQLYDRESFLCPYCLYKQSVVECHQAKDKALLAEKNLALFLGGKSSVNREHEPDVAVDKSTTLQNRKELGNQEGVRKNKERVRFQTENDPKNGECSHVHLRASFSTPGQKGGYLRNCSMKPVENQKNCEGQFYGHAPSNWEGKVLVVEPVSACRPSSPIHRSEVNEESDSLNETFTACNDGRNAYSRLAKESTENAFELKNNSPGKACDPNGVNTSDAGWISRPSNEILNGAFFSRRKRVRWTTEEEETLMKGVLCFSSNARKNLSWRKVLEFGNGVFHQSRTPQDLQSKWKIMSRKMSEVK